MRGAFTVMSKHSSMSKKEKRWGGDAAERLVDEFSLNHIVNCVEKPRQLRTPPGRVLLPSVPRWLGNQRSRQNDGGYPKQNPANNHTNRFSSSWSRQRKFDQSKLIKPPTCYYYRKEGHLISSCPEKRRVAQKQNSMEPKPNSFIAKPSSLSPASEDTPPRVPRKKTQTSPMSKVSGQSKSVMNIFKPFIYNGSVSLSSNTPDSIPIKIGETLKPAVFTVE